VADSKGFEFRLETLLSYRSRILELRAQELAEAQRAVNAAETLCDRLRNEQTVCWRSISAPDRNGRLDVDLSKAMNRYLDYLAEAITRQTAEIGRLKEETETCRLEAVEASKRKKVVERLRERDMEEFLDGLADDERKFLDEVGSVRAASQGRNARSGPGGSIQRGAVIQ